MAMFHLKDMIQQDMIQQEQMSPILLIYCSIIVLTPETLTQTANRIEYNEFLLKSRHNMEVLFLHPYQKQGPVAVISMGFSGPISYMVRI